LLTVFQSGLRRYQSTTAAMLKVTEDIRLSLENAQVTGLLLLDFSQRLIWWCMSCCCGSCKMLRTIRLVPLFWWGNRALFVRSGGQESSVGAVAFGVPQGSVLGLLLFLSYIEDDLRVIRYCRFHIYADDLQI
jgi:hypothetical protein